MLTPFAHCCFCCHPPHNSPFIVAFCFPAFCIPGPQRTRRARDAAEASAVTVSRKLYATRSELDELRSSAVVLARGHVAGTVRAVPTPMEPRQPQPLREQQQPPQQQQQPEHRPFRFGFAEAIGIGSRSSSKGGTLDAEVEWLDSSLEPAVPAPVSRVRKVQQGSSAKRGWSDEHEMETLLQMQTSMHVADERHDHHEQPAPVRVADAVHRGWRGRKGRQRLQAAKTAARVGLRTT